MNANAAACILACCLVLMISVIRLQRGLGSKTVMYLFSMVLMVGILVTRSRSGLMALAGTIGLMALIGQNRRLAWMIVVAGLIVGTLFSGMRQGNGCSQALPYSDPAEPEMFWPRSLGALTTASMLADSRRCVRSILAARPRVGGDRPCARWAGRIRNDSTRLFNREATERAMLCPLSS